MEDETSSGFSLNCRQTHRLLSERMDRQLGLLELARMHMHLWACIVCRTFNDQMQMLRGAMRNFTVTADDPSDSNPDADSQDQGLQPK